jgi:hypothetical protein
MKKIILLLSLFCASILIHAQRVIDVNSGEYSAAQFFNSVGGEPVLGAKFVRLTEGSPFFSDEWKPAIIRLSQEALYRNKNVKLDIYNNNVHFLDDKGKEFLSSSKIRELWFIPSPGDTIHLMHSALLPGMTKSGWYQVLVADTVSLYKRLHKIMVEDKPYGSATTEQKLRDEEKFILGRGDDVYLELKKPKDLETHFFSYSKDLDTFARSLAQGQSLQEKYVLTVQFLNSKIKKTTP